MSKQKAAQNDEVGEYPGINKPRPVGGQMGIVGDQPPPIPEEPKKPRDYGPPPSAPPIVKEFEDIAQASEPTAKPKQRMTDDDIQALAAVSRILKKAEKACPGAALRILYWIASGRGLELREIGGPCDDRR